MSSHNSEPSAKRRKTWDPSTFIYTKPPVKLQVTKNGRTHTWYLNKELLVKESSKFRDLLRTTDVVSLDPSTVEETMERFSAWIFTRDLVIPEPDSPDNSDKGLPEEVWKRVTRSNSTIVKREEPSKGTGISVIKPWFADLSMSDQTYGRLLDLYVFAIQYQVPSLKAEVLLRWQRHTFQNNDLLGTEVLNKALLALPLDDSLIRFQVADYGYVLFGTCNSTDLDYGRLPALFLVKLLEFGEQYAEADEQEKESLNPNDDWCKFHNHSIWSNENRDCRRRRPNDPDVKNKRTAY